jgi:hypothetical protein
LLTGLIIFFSLRTSRGAIAEAKQAAEKEVSNWLAEKGDKAIKPFQDSLQNQGADILADIHERGIETLKKIEAKADHHHQRMEALESKSEALLDRLSASQWLDGKVLDPEDVLELQRITKLLEKKPENQYTFDDWRALYLEAANRNALDEVDKYVVGMERAAKDDWQFATAKNGRAWLLNELERYDECQTALKTFQ